MPPPGVFHLGEGRGVCLGPGPPALLHAHQATQFCVPLSGAVRSRSGPAQPWREYAAAVIPSDCPHESDVALEEIVRRLGGTAAGEAQPPKIRDMRARSELTVEESELAERLTALLHQGGAEDATRRARNSGATGREWG